MLYEVNKNDAQGAIFEKGFMDITIPLNSWRASHHENHIMMTYPKADVSKYAPNLSKVVTLGIDKAIVMHCLKRLASKGNQTAFELIAGHEGIFSIEDLQQDVLCYLSENKSLWFIDDDNKLVFLDDETMRGLFGVVSKSMYQFQTKHYAHMYIEIDGDAVRYNDVANLATYCNIDAIYEREDIKVFMTKLSDTEKTFLHHRLNGVSAFKSAELMGLTRQNIRTIEKHIRKKWELFTK